MGYFSAGYRPRFYDIPEYWFLATGGGGPLLTPGYWQPRYWARGYWEPHYWPHYGTGTAHGSPGRTDYQRAWEERQRRRYWERDDEEILVIIAGFLARRH